MAHIRWSDCYNALGATVQDVRRTGSYSDVLLYVGGAVIPSHKLVLISASMYFKDLFENCVLDARSYVVIIPDCTVDEINALLDFMYLGECSGTREEISRILQIGARLKVRGMKESLLKESMEQNLLQESVEQKDQYNSLFPLAFNRSFMEHLQKAGHIPNPSFVLNTNGPNFNVGDAAATVQHQEEVASGPCNDDAAVPLTTRNTVPRRSNAASSNKRKSQSPPLKRRRVDSGKKDATAAPCPPLTPVVEESSVAATDDAAGVEDERAAVAQSEAQEDSAPLEEESSTTASHVVDHCLVKTEYQNDDNPPEALMNPKMELVCGDDNNQSAVNDFQHNSDCHSGTSVGSNATATTADHYTTYSPAAVMQQHPSVLLGDSSADEERKPPATPDPHDQSPAPQQQDLSAAVPDTPPPLCLTVAPPQRTPPPAMAAPPCVSPFSQFPMGLCEVVSATANSISSSTGHHNTSTNSSSSRCYSGGKVSPLYGNGATTGSRGGTPDMPHNANQAALPLNSYKFIDMSGGGVIKTESAPLAADLKNGTSLSSLGAPPAHHLLGDSVRQTYNCSLCGKQFGQPYNLRRHMSTHTGLRPFQCPHCDYAASQNVHLDKHIRRIHLNISAVASDASVKMNGHSNGVNGTSKGNGVLLMNGDTVRQVNGRLAEKSDSTKTRVSNAWKYEGHAVTP